MSSFLSVRAVNQEWSRLISLRVCPHTSLSSPTRAVQTRGRRTSFWRCEGGLFTTPNA